MPAAVIGLLFIGSWTRTLIVSEWNNEFESQACFKESGSFHQDQVAW
jgi:hypothetical protein